MEGYDVVLIASFYGHPAFLKKYGVPGPEGKNIIPAAWQSGLGNGSSAGGIIGLLINGRASEKIGPRRTFLVAMVLMIGAIFVPVLAESLPGLTFGEVLCGIPWGESVNEKASQVQNLDDLHYRHLSDSDDRICLGGEKQQF